MSFHKLLFLLLLLGFIAHEPPLELEAKGLRKSNKITKEEEPEEPTRNEMKLRLKAKEMIMEGEGKRSTQKIEGEMDFLMVKCPMCTEKIKTIHVKKQMQSKGIDRDFCRHTFRKSALDFDLWCCPHCGYTHFKNFFPLELEQEFIDQHKERLRLNLYDSLRKSSGVNIDKLGFILDQEDILTSIKFSQMQLVLKDLNLPLALQADFHLRFAWSERIRLCQPISDPALSNSIGMIIERLKLYEHKTEQERIISDPKAMLAFFSSLGEERREKVINFLCQIYEAQQWDRLGYPSKAKSLLRSALKQAPSDNARKVPLFKIKVLENEIYHLKEALVCFKEAIKTEDTNLDLTHLPYLIGELYRRIELFAESKAWLKLAKKLIAEQEDKSFVEWIEDTQNTLPKNMDLKVQESELILIAKTEKMIRERKAKLISETDTNTQPNFSKGTIDQWLESIHKASVFYYKELNIDPKNVQELVDMGLFKNDPRLEKQAPRLFRLNISKTEFNPISRYNINCLISFSDQEGYYWPSLIEGELTKSRQL